MGHPYTYFIDNVILTRRGAYFEGSLTFSNHHLVFSCSQTSPAQRAREVWICFPMIEQITRARGSSWSQVSFNDEIMPQLPSCLSKGEFDKYSASHIRVRCKDFTFYSFDFCNDSICQDAFTKISELINIPRLRGSPENFYAFEYLSNEFELKLFDRGWNLYDATKEYKRQGFLEPSDSRSFWRLSKVNEGYKLCQTYPQLFIAPSCIPDSVIQHAAKFRSKQRVPAVVYRHKTSRNGNVIARCSQPLVGLNLQNRSIQDEKFIEEIFRAQNSERNTKLDGPDIEEQPQKNLIVDLRPITNAIAQHALGAGTENIDNYRGRHSLEKPGNRTSPESVSQKVDKVFCNIDNIHVMRDSLEKLTKILGDLDRKAVCKSDAESPSKASLQNSLTKTMWLHHVSLILQAVDRIIKSVHLNNTNVIIHCSDGWDRTSQASALAQLCLDPYYRTFEGFMVLIEKEWVSFGFKFSTRSDLGGCIGALLPRAARKNKQRCEETEPPFPEEKSSHFNSSSSLNLKLPAEISRHEGTELTATKLMTTFFQRAASHIKSSTSGSRVISGIENKRSEITSTYGGSNERSPVFHQFLDCVFQIYRQQPSMFEFNSRFLKRLLYHSYSCQYGTFLCDSEKERNEAIRSQTTSVWTYFLSRRGEFTNPEFNVAKNEGVVFFKFSEVKWWSELYGRSEEEMNGLSNSLDEKFAKLNIMSNTCKSEAFNSLNSEDPT